MIQKKTKKLPSKSPIRSTRQQKAILKVIEESQGPLLLEEILKESRKAHKGIGIATIYRSIKRLVESKLVRSIVLPNGETRFEKIRAEHHHHFQCRGCSRIFHLDVCPITIPAGTVFPGGMLIESHDLVLYGKCADCR